MIAAKVMGQLATYDKKDGWRVKSSPAIERYLNIATTSHRLEGMPWCADEENQVAYAMQAELGKEFQVVKLNPLVREQKGALS